MSEIQELNLGETFPPKLPIIITEDNVRGKGATMGYDRNFHSRIIDRNIKYVESKRGCITIRENIPTYIVDENGEQVQDGYISITEVNIIDGDLRGNWDRVLTVYKDDPKPVYAVHHHNGVLIDYSYSCDPSHLETIHEIVRNIRSCSLP